MTFCLRTFAAKVRVTDGVSGTELQKKGLARGGADAVWANCGVGPQPYVRVAHLKPLTPVRIKPNAGLPVLKDGQTVFPMVPEEFASFVPELVRAGAKFIGGCCGTTPEHIRAIRKAVAS